MEYLVSFLPEQLLRLIRGMKGVQKEIGDISIPFLKKSV